MEFWNRRLLETSPDADAPAIDGKGLADWLEVRKEEGKQGGVS